MGHSNIRIKIRERKVANLAAYSKKYTVKNTTNCISPVINHKVYYDTDIGNAITCPFTGHKFVPVNPHPIPGKFGITITGYDYIQPAGLLWKREKHKQPANLRKRVRGENPVYETINDKLLIVASKDYDYKSEFPSYEQHKMNRVEYMEKLVQHKLAKWERKNPKPEDVFKEDVAKWNVMRMSAEERLRDFVISVYDKLKIYTRHSENGTFTCEKEAGEVKDTTGEGHNVTELKPSSKLYKKAQEIVTKKAETDKTVSSGRIVSHNKRTGAIILPKSAQLKNAA